MSVYRVRISDEIYGILRAEALASGASLERLVEACVFDGLARRSSARDGSAAPDDGLPSGAGMRRLASAPFPAARSLR